jgi:hypothetical protein
MAVDPQNAPSTSPLRPAAHAGEGRNKAFLQCCKNARVSFLSNARKLADVWPEIFMVNRKLLVQDAARRLDEDEKGVDTYLYPWRSAGGAPIGAPAMGRHPS